MMKGDDIVSSCQSVFVGDRRVEIYVENGERYRRQGFAILCASAFIEHCLEKGLLPVWSCWDYEWNIASINPAQKLGSSKKKNVQVKYVRVGK